MKLGLKYRELWRTIGAWATDELDQIVAAIQGSWKVEHNDDDSHSHVHANTLQVGRISFRDIFTPQAFATSPVNNFNDQRLRDAGLLRVSSTLTEVSLTGIQAPVDENGSILDARMLVIENIHATAVVALEHEDTRSSPANRFDIPHHPASVTGASNRFFLLPGQMVVLQYNSVLARWRVRSKTNDEILSYVEFGSSQNDYAPPNFRAARVVRLVPTAANLTISGFDATAIPVPSRRTIINEGLYRFAILHMNTGSTAANRVQCPGGTMYYLHPRESVDVYRETDGTWHIVLKADQWVDVTYAAANFSQDTGTWTVDSADQATYCYQIDGNKMTVSFEINNTDVAGAPNFLRIKVPAGRTIARTTRAITQIVDAGAAATVGAVVAAAGQTFLDLYTITFAAWTNTAADNTRVLGQITFMVETSCATVTENHTDVAHGDTAHSDADHSDVAHVDVVHVDSHADVVHADVGHSDSVHQDTHGDVTHIDTPHSDTPHGDGHGDTHDDSHTDDHTDFNDGHDDNFTDGPVHGDTPHVDDHGDIHGDVAHADSHSDTAHTDAGHADSAHQDTPHDDAHADVAHLDSAHSDTPHSDSHSDTPHSDIVHTDGGHADTAHVDAPHNDVGYHCDTSHADC